MDGFNSFEYKVCPQCSEPVRITATKCPHCLSWQGRKFSVNNPIVAAFLPMLVLPFFLPGPRSDEPRFCAARSSGFHPSSLERQRVIPSTGKTIPRRALHARTRVATTVAHA